MADAAKVVCGFGFMFFAMPFGKDDTAIMHFPRSNIYSFHQSFLVRPVKPQEVAGGYDGVKVAIGMDYGREMSVVNERRADGGAWRDGKPRHFARDFRFDLLADLPPPLDFDCNDSASCLDQQVDLATGFLLRSRKPEGRRR